MVADTMERLVQLVSSLMFAIGLTACSTPSIVKKDSENLDLRKRVVEFNKSPYTGFVYEGPSLIKSINKSLLDYENN